MKARYIVAEKPKEEPSKAEFDKTIEKGIKWLEKHKMHRDEIEIYQNIIPNVDDADSYMKYKKTEEIRLRINARLSRKTKVERK